MSFFLQFKSNYMINNDVIIVESRPYERFQFQQVPTNKSQESMLIRFLTEYGPDIPENDPDEVQIVSFEHTPFGNDLHHLKIEYQMNGRGYQVEVEYNYSPTPNPDFFTNVAFEDLAIYQISNNTLT